MANNPFINSFIFLDFFDIYLNTPMIVKNNHKKNPNTTEYNIVNNAFFKFCFIFTVFI